MDEQRPDLLTGLNEQRRLDRAERERVLRREAELVSRLVDALTPQAGPPHQR